MTTQPKPKQSIFPDMPRSQRVVDENGNINYEWSLFFSQLSQALQVNFKNEGIVVPPLTAANIANLTNIKSANNVIYDVTDFNFQGNLPLPTGSATTQRWIPFAMITSYPGNPNGHVAGQLNWFCWDSSHLDLFICTTSGKESTAVWTAVFAGGNSFLLL